MRAWSDGNGTGSARPRRREQWVEVGVFLFLIVPSMALSFFLVNRGVVDFLLVSVSTILRDLSLLALVLFFLWRNGEPRTRIGWTPRNAGREALLGLVLFVPFFFATHLMEQALLDLGLHTPSAPMPGLDASGGIGQSLLGIVLVAVVAVTEESIFRGYLMLRFEAMTSSSAAAVILSAAIFALGHGYEGSAGVVTVGFMGAVFALVYLWRGSLVAPIVIHFLQDIIGIVLLPLLGGH
jgi:membrane protease YdiL (CAAX protease family)